MAGPRSLAAIQTLLLLLVSASTAAAAGLPLPSTSVITGGIPRILHYVWTGSLDGLEKSVKSGGLRPEHRRSCVAHHPGWQHILWDEDMCLRLLETNYPWFVEAYKKMPTVVVRADTMRYFILHTYGGVYVDFDVECFGNLESSLKGRSLVANCEAWEHHQTANGQMASVAGHPFWERMMMRFKERFPKLPDGVSGLDILKLSGPMAFTEELRAYITSMGHSDEKLCRSFPDLGLLMLPTMVTNWPNRPLAPLPHPTPLATFFPGRTWFMLCLHYEDACKEEVAKCAHVIRQMRLCEWHQQLWPETTWSTCLTEAERKDYHMPQLCKFVRDPRKTSHLSPAIAECAQKYRLAAGYHHFGGSWVKEEDRPKNLESPEKQKVALARFNTPEAFVEAPGFCAANLAKTSREPAATTDASEFSTFLRKALQPVLVGAPPPQPAGGKAEVQRFRSCLVVSVLQTQCNLCQHKDKKAKCCITQEQKAERLEHLRALATQTERLHCKLRVITNLEAAEVTEQLTKGPGGVQPERLTVETKPLTFGACEKRTQDMLLKALEHRSPGEPKLIVLHVSAPGACTWELGHLINTQGFLMGMEHAQPSLVILELGVLRSASLHRAKALYNLMTQSLGYLGQAYTQPLHTKHTDAEKIDGCAVCGSKADDDSEYLIRPLWLAYVKRERLAHNVATAMLGRHARIDVFTGHLYSATANVRYE